MRHDLKSVLIPGALFLVLSGAAHAKPIMPDSVMNQEITRPLNRTTMDEYLLDMARAAGLNVIADATEFPATSPVQAYPSTSGAIAGQKGEYRDKWGPVFINLMGDFAAQKKLNILRSDERTFLFWSEGEPSPLLDLQRPLAQADQAARFAESVAAARADGVPEEDIISGELPDARLQQVLRDYLKTEHGWTGTAGERNNKVDIRVPFDDLPPGLRALVLQGMRNFLANPREYRFLQDEFWKTSDWRFRAEKDKTGDRTTLNAEYRVVQDDGRETRDGLPLAVLDDSVLDEVALTNVVTTPVAVDDPVAPPQQGENAKDQALAPPLAQPQRGAQETLATVYSGLSEEASDPVLDADVTLQSAISLQVVRLPLRDLLAQLQQQSGIHLTLGEAAPAAKLVTARVENMPLSKLMGVLSRIYGVKWSKGQGEGTTYVMRGNDQGELHLKLLQIGDPNRYRFRFMFYNRADRENGKAALGLAVVKQVGLQALQTPDGVAFSALPPFLQKQVRRSIEEPTVERQAIRLYQTNRMIAEQTAKKGLVLRFGTSVSETYRTPFLGISYDRDEPPGRLMFNVQSEDGQIVMPAFDFFSVPVAKPGEQAVRPPSRRR